MVTEPKKRLLDIPMGLAVLPLIFTGIAVAAVWAVSMDVKNLVINVLGYSVTFSPLWPPLFLIIWGLAKVVGAKRDWWWRPAAIGCPMSLLYLATGVAIYLTKSPPLLLAVILINMLVPPIIEIIKPKNQSALPQALPVTKADDKVIIEPTKEAPASEIRKVHAGTTNCRAQLAKGLVLFGLVLLIVVVTPVVIILWVIPAPGAAELGPYIDEYINDTGLTDVTDLNDPYRVGKLVAVDPRGRQLDTKLQKALPDDLRAAMDDEVGTIVWVSWSERIVGTYKDGEYGPERGHAFRGFCEITVIDRVSALIVIRRRFEAPSPPSTTTGGGDVHTRVDVDDIVKFLANLPDEPPHVPMSVSAPTLVPGSTMTIRLTGPDSGIYSATEAPNCTRYGGTPLDKWEIVDNTIPQDQHSLGKFLFSGWLGDSPIEVESATSELMTAVTIGPGSGGRTYVVSKTQGGSGTFSIDDRGSSAILTFTGKTASGVLMAWTVECSNPDTGLVQTSITPTPSNPVTVLPSAKVNVYRANLREGPGLNYAVITSLTQDSLLTVLERTDASDWFKVQVNDSGITGWISNTVIDLSSDPLEIPSQ